MLKNCGLGSAILKRMELIISSKETAPVNPRSWDSLLKSIGFGGKAGYYYIIGEDALSAGQERSLLNLEIPELPVEKIKEFNDKLNNLQIRIYYTSMYNEDFQYISNKHDELT